MSEESVEQEEEVTPPTPLLQSMSMAAGAMLSVDIVSEAAHFGPTGLVVGGIAALVAWRHGPAIRAWFAQSDIAAALARYRAQRRQQHLAAAVAERPDAPAFGSLDAWEYEEDSAPAARAAKPVDAPMPALLTLTPSRRSAIPTPEPVTLMPPRPPKRQSVPVKVLHLGYNVETHERFTPHINQFLGRGALIAGSQGTGKSNLIGLLATSCGECSMPLVVIDYKGEFYPLCETLPNGIRAGHPSMREDVDGGFFGLTVESASELAALVMETPFQVIIDIPSYHGNNDSMARALAAFLHALMDYAVKVRRSGTEPWPCVVVTDEAHHFVPQMQNLSGLAMRNPKESFGTLMSAYSRMANTGRSFGYTLVMATQRLPNIAKWSIANLHNKFILAHAEKNDLDACVAETGGLIDREDIKHLPIGTGIVLGFTKEPCRVQFDAQPHHVSTTPGIERIAEQFGNTPKHVLIDDVREYRPAGIVPETIPGTFSQYQRTEQRGNTPLRRRHHFTPSERGTPVHSTEREYHESESGGQEIPGTVPDPYHKRFTPEQKVLFIQHHQITHNIQKSIARMHISYGRYQRHASEIVRAIREQQS